jgi:tetratricopeptide (TPR) repeat protein
MLIAPVNADEIGNKNRKANKLFSKGQYEEALKLYDDALLLDPSNNKLKMNKGSALYKLDQLDEAEKLYEEALAQEDKKARADAHYNLGNIQYKQVAQLESAGNAASARGKYSQALESYVNTLKLRPNDKDAKWNLQLAHQKVNLLENQPDQGQDENQDKNQDDKGDQNKQKDDGKDKDKKDGQDQDNKNDDQSKGDQDQQDGQDGQDQQDQQQQPRDQDERDMKREEAGRLIDQYADDADTLNKPRFQRGRVRQPEKDW